jgi:Molybdopterin converting factor, large subunit
VLPEVTMDITKVIAEMKKEPGFSENVGMVLVHNGVVRGWARKDHKPVTGIEVAVDEHKVEVLREEYSQKPGIYKILIECRSGKLNPGDDLLFIVVAGDIRENVKPVLSELLDRIKAEAVTKTEIT